MKIESRFRLLPVTFHQVIKVSMAKYAGDHAADLVGRLLEPSPHKRLKNMKDILCHSYFTEEVGHFTI